MPIYEYRCDNCDHEFETIQKVSDAPLEECPECSEKRLRKKVSAAGFRLKGGGWYETDFKAGNKRNVTGDDGAGRNGAGTSGEGSSGGSGDGKNAAGSGGSKNEAGKAADSKTKSGASASSAPE
ncbi:MAG: FmdB family zinc ribbon protein [Pseudomonadota bacterium]